jgi:uncharacterized protein
LIAGSHWWWLFGAGLSAGFVDAMAGGGGLITVPALLSVGLPPQLALGTNKMQAACGTGLAVFRFARARLLTWRDVRLAVTVTFAAAVLGTLAVASINPRFLRSFIPWLLLAVGIYTFASPKLGYEPHHQRMKTAPFALLFGSLLGFYDGFFGPGVGSFWTVAFVLLLGLDLRQATARTKAVNLTSNVAALAVFLAAGQVRFDVAGVMIAGQLVGAWLGAHLVITRGARFIRLVFLTTVFALTFKLLWQK